MRLTIIPDDNAVYVDGKVRSINNVRSLLPKQWADARAVQWDGSKGHVEDSNMRNTPLTDVSEFSDIIDAWNGAAPK